MHRRRTLAGIALLWLASGAHDGRVRGATPPVPPAFERYLAQEVRLPAADRTRLLNGEPVTRMLEGDASAEVGAFGAVWIAAPMQRYAEAMLNIESFERGANFRQTRRISEPPVLEDFASLRLSDDDVADLRTCRVGHCEVKLSEAALQRVRREVDWRAPDHRARAEQVARHLALDYVTSYLSGGNGALAVYRDAERPTFVEAELRGLVGRLPELTSFVPEVRGHLLGFPSVTLPGSRSLLYWQETAFGLKPTVRISHLTLVERDEGMVVTSKMLYASHYFWTGLELRVLLPDPARGPGFWFITVTRTRSDGLSGFRGAIIRRMVRGEAEKGTLTALRSTKVRMERTMNP